MDLDSGAVEYLPNCFYLTIVMCMLNFPRILKISANWPSFVAVHMVIADALAWHHPSIPPVFLAIAP